MAGTYTSAAGNCAEYKILQEGVCTFHHAPSQDWIRDATLNWRLVYVK